jgi:hypothetical protein
MASGKSAVGFVLAKTYVGYDQIVDYCMFHSHACHSDIRTKKVYLFTRSEALKVSTFVKTANIDAVFVNILKDGYQQRCVIFLCW